MIRGEVMSEERCIHCGRIIPEGRITCQMCDREISQMGRLLQSADATKEDIVGAYSFLEEELKKKIIKEN